MSRRRLTRTLVLSLVTAMTVPLMGGSTFARGAPAEATSASGGPAAVTTRCAGGPGRVTMAVSAPNEDGAYPVTVTGTRMVEGSAWRVLVEWEEDAQQQRFRPTAVDGSWSVSAVFGGSDVEPAFNVEASGSVD